MKNKQIKLRPVLKIKMIKLQKVVHQIKLQTIKREKMNTKDLIQHTAT